VNDSIAGIVTTTIFVSCTATAIVIVPGVLLAYLLARHEFRGKTLLAGLVTMPLVLPPTVIGVLLLRLFATDGPLGSRSIGVDLDIVLSWKGAAIASAVMSSPLLVRTARLAFEGVPHAHEQLARTLGYGPIETFFRFTVPMAGRGLLAAIVLGFTRALGEYGATVTVAGSIPGETRTLASAIVAADQAGHRREVSMLALVALALGLVAVVVSERLGTSRVARIR